MLSKPLAVTITSLVIAIIAAFIIVPNVGNPPTLASLPPAISIDQDMVDTASTTVAAGTPTQLSFQASGRVGVLNVNVGDIVTKGEILASLDSAVPMSAVNQAKAALDLAKAQYSSISLQYSNAKNQQDTLVNNAYRTLLSSGLQARSIGVIDESHNPTVSGTYTCDKEGSYEIDLYGSGATSGYSFNVSGLEKGNGTVTFGSPQPLGTCGLYVTFVPGFSGGDKWLVAIPNTQSSGYQANQNAYDLAVTTRDQTLSQLGASIGVNASSTDGATASAAISVAESAYEAAEAQYANTVIASPVDGTVTFIDSSLKVGQSVMSNQRVMTINSK